MKKVRMLFWISLALILVLLVLSAMQIGILCGFCTVNLQLVNKIGTAVFIAVVISLTCLGILFFSGGHDKA